ncbi:MAG: protein-disulfide reductase DsbD domain-containing protein [Pseudomonadota bacterium]|nr:protein-disulfide reductase DsbD domain-containing protein [Pseudomonadota bacterium]
MIAAPLLSAASARRRAAAAALVCAVALGFGLDPGPAAAGGGLLAAWRVTQAPPAAPAATAEGQRSRTALLAGWPTQAGARVAGLRIALDPGWKTYWRVPGDAGIPPEFDWSASDNVAAVAVRWPRPHAFESFGMTTLGYKGDVVLPLEITPTDPTRPVALRLSFAYGVCSDICVPEMADMALDLPPALAADAGPIRAALADLPRPAETAGAALSGCGLRVSGAHKGAEGGSRLDRRLEVDLHLPGPVPEGTVAVVEGAEPGLFAPASLSPAPGGLRLAARVSPGAGTWIDRDAITVTLVEPGRATEFHGCR